MIAVVGNGSGWREFVKDLMAKHDGKVLMYSRSRARVEVEGKTYIWVNTTIGSRGIRWTDVLYVFGAVDLPEYYEIKQNIEIELRIKKLL